MAKINWTGQALDDLNDIADYIAAKSPNFAAHLVKKCFDGTKMLARFPRMGRVVPESNLASIRELIIHQYRIMYVVNDLDEVQILAVRHSSRPLNSDFILNSED